MRQIKRSLAQYEKFSILKCGLNYLVTQECGNKNIAMSMPWLIFLLIKWSMQEEANGKIPITQGQLLEVANQLYQLQSLAADLKGAGGLVVKLRRMLMQQSAPQTHPGDNALSFSRQRNWFEKSRDKYFEECFKKASGISLSTFFDISSYFLLHVNAKESPIYDMGRLVIDLSPSTSLRDIALYLTLVAVKIEEIPEFMKVQPASENKPAEYFSDTPFLFKPLIVNGQQLIVANRNVFMRAMASFVSNTLKKVDGRRFKNHFGDELERYVSELLKRTGMTFTPEAEIKALYKEMNYAGKVVDFIIEDRFRIFLDCKAIEPNEYISTLADPAELAEGLKESYIKAIWQGQECCHLVNKSARMEPRAPFLLVVVHRDHYISSGVRVAEDLKNGIEAEIVAEYGYVPIPLERIYYLTIHDFERILSNVRLKNQEISSMLEKAVQADKKAETNKLLFSMHVDEFHGQNDEELISAAEEEFTKVLEVVEHNQSYWNGKAQQYLRRRSELIQIVHNAERKV